MGCYDTCRIECPECGAWVDVQSKAGECSGSRFPLEKTPISILADIENESKNGRIMCFSCGCDLAIVIAHSVKVKALSNQKQYDPDWDECYEDEE